MANNISITSLELTNKVDVHARRSVKPMISNEKNNFEIKSRLQEIEENIMRELEN